MTEQPLASMSPDQVAQRLEGLAAWFDSPQEAGHVITRLGAPA